MNKRLTHEYKIIDNIIKMYEDRLSHAVNGKDSMKNDIELEILYVLYNSLNEHIKSNELFTEIPDEIRDAWLAVQMHFTLLCIREEKINTNNDCEMFDDVSHQLYLNIVDK